MRRLRRAVGLPNRPPIGAFPLGRTAVAATHWAAQEALVAGASRHGGL